MTETTQEEIVKSLYASFPQDSRAKQSDNPWAYEQFISNNGILGSHSFDNAVLCLDRSNGRYTWHIVCDEFSLTDIRFASELSGLEQKLKKIRHGRDLKCTEVVTKFGEHYHIESSVISKH